MHRFPVVLLLLIMSFEISIAQGKEVVYEAPGSGFRITLPDVGWIHSEQGDPKGLVRFSAGPPEAQGLITLGIQVALVVDTSDEGVRSQILQLREAIRGNDAITDVEGLEHEIGGRKALGIRVHQAAHGQTFRVHLFFVRVQGLQYRIQFHAPRGRFDAEWEKAKSVLAGFEFIDLDVATRDRVMLRSLAARCGSQVDWATSWEDAARRARKGGRLIVVSIFAQSGFELGNRLDEAVFTSPEVLGLMRHRFVGWRWQKGMDAPFVDHDVFGLSASTFGVGLLVCSPEGNVLRQIFLPEAGLVAEALREVLWEHPGLAPPPSPPKDGSIADRAAFLTDSGELAAAWKLLDGERDEARSSGCWYQRARLHAIAREGDAGLAALKEARGRWSSEDSSRGSRAVLDLLEADIRIGMGRYEEAERVLRKGLSRKPDETLESILILRRGLLAWQRGDRDGAKTFWTDVTRRFSDEPAAWIAAAGLIGPALKIDMTPDLTWPTETHRRLTKLPDPAPPAESLTLPKALTAAAEWLLAAQREDGGWDLPFDQRNTHISPDQIVMASQAICVTALARVAAEGGPTERAQAERYREAALLGLDRYLAYRKAERAHPRPVAFMDYTCWGGSYGLFCLTRVLDPATGMLSCLSKNQVKALREEAAHLVADLCRIQAANGGWSYYLSGEVDGAVTVTAMSFTTATVLDALHKSAEAGFEVPEEVLARGVDCLISLRGDNGNFQYLRQGEGPYRAGVVAPEGSAARGPLCTLALIRADRLEVDAMRPAFETYVNHLPGFGREARKALMHAGTATQGSHYLLYDYATAAEALRTIGRSVIGENLASRVIAAISREMKRCHNVEGSFVDNPIIGTAPGTGLAICTLLDLTVLRNEAQ